MKVQVRCYNCGKVLKDPSDFFCYGCSNYVCDTCSISKGLHFGSHESHLPFYDTRFPELRKAALSILMINTDKHRTATLVRRAAEKIFKEKLRECAATHLIRYQMAYYDQYRQFCAYTELHGLKKDGEKHARL